MSSPTTSHELFAAIEAGDVERVEALVADDPTLASARDAGGVSAVLSARYRGHHDVADVLLARRPALDVFDAAALGRTGRLSELLDQRPDLLDAAAADGFTPLQLASFFGQPQAVDLLIARGADVNAPSGNAAGLHALHSAVAGRHVEVVALLLAGGAEPGARQRGGWTPLMAGAAHGDEDIVGLLLDQGADPTARNDDGKTAADLAEEAGHPPLAGRLRPAPDGAAGKGP
jgi:ankyrin repeat protein